MWTQCWLDSCDVFWKSFQRIVGEAAKDTALFIPLSAFDDVAAKICNLPRMCFCIWETPIESGWWMGEEEVQVNSKWMTGCNVLWEMKSGGENTRILTKTTQRGRQDRHSSSDNTITNKGKKFNSVLASEIFALIGSSEKMTKQFSVIISCCNLNQFEITKLLRKWDSRESSEKRQSKKH